MDECDSIIKGKKFGIVEGTGGDFITVVSVGVNNKSVADSVNVNNKYNDTTNSSDYITVLTIGDEKFYQDEKCFHEEQHQIEEVLVYRLPGERLGFGLKFDGGIKASEPVKRLFIQSCAVDSPASRVKSSWGMLVEGDEVLEIDRIPVNNMTRIDCVRCLKDSNVVITLLIRHLGCHIPDAIALSRRTEELANGDILDNLNDFESKRLPPPPPPVPPRKIPRNSTKKADVVSRSDSLKKVHQSPEFAKREAAASRVIADGGLGPPNAQIYMDLFSQESLYSLSESDDTSSSISTVVDRLSSFPTTSASSLAGSLPSTPTAIQNKRLHLNNVLSSLEADMHFMNDKDYYLFERLTSLSQADVDNAIEMDDLPPVIPPRHMVEREVIGSVASTLQLHPPTNFQDAPLSYGNEDVGVMETTIKTAAREFMDKQQQQQVIQKPSPRARQNTPAVKIRQHHQSNQSNSEFIEVDGKTRNGYDTSDKLEDAVPVDDEEQNYQKVVAAKASWKIRPPPRAKQQQAHREQNNNDCDKHTVDLIIPETFDEKSTNVNNNNNNATFANNNLPRLVDFVPKYSKQRDEDEEKTYGNGSGGMMPPQDCANREENGGFGIGIGTNVWNGADFGTRKCSSTTQQLATIGEVEETPQHVSFHSVDISENGISDELPVASVILISDNSKGNGFISSNDKRKMNLDFVMASPPIYSRQPPDGHEFPDYEERQHQDALTEIQSSNDHDTLDMNTHQQQTFTSDSSIAEAIDNNLAEYPDVPTTSPPALPPMPNFMTFTKIELRSEVVRPEDAEPLAVVNGQRSSFDLTLLNTSKALKPTTTADIFDTPRTLHSRSQSLVDISKPDRWSQIAEQRQRGLSKLKGLVIPEHVPSESCHTVYDLPEITSSTKMPKLPDYQPLLNQVTVPALTKTMPSQRSSVNLPTPIWKQQEANVASSLPKYSPAFKRRSLQLYTNGHMTQRSSPATVTPSVERFSTGCLSTEPETQLPAITSSSEDGVSFERNSSLPSLNDSDNDSAFKSCESLHSLEYSNSTTQKDIETVNKRNIHPTPPPVLATAADIFQKKCLKYGQQNSQLVRSPKVIANDHINFDKVKQNLIKTNRNASKIEASSKLGSNSYAVSPNRTVPKIMQSKPVATVNDLRKKFQSPDVVPFVRANSKIAFAESPPSTKPTGMAPKKLPIAVKIEEKVATSAAPVKQQDPLHKISTQETMSEITQVLSEFGESVRKEDCFVAKLKPEVPGGSLGLTLAGGTDYEAKEITVYSIRSGSVASKENKLKRGDQILSINGKVMKNLTHADTTAILKESKAEFEIVYYSRNEPISPIVASPKRNSRSFDLPSPTVNEPSQMPVAPLANANTGEGHLASSVGSIVVNIVKTSAGLGFSIAGGVDSPTGDVPLTVKKVFAGGAAEKSGVLLANDELLMIGGVNVTAMSRLDVWTMMKKLPEGPVSLTVRR